MTVGEAAELAPGYCYARHPALLAATLSAAVDYVLMSLQLLRPVPFSVERDGREYREVAPHNLAQHIGYMFRFDERGKPYAAASLKEDLASVAALYLVRHDGARLHSTGAKADRGAAQLRQPLAEAVTAAQSE